MRNTVITLVILLTSNYALSQDIITVREVYAAIYSFDTITVKKYFENGGSIDAQRDERMTQTVYGGIGKKTSTNLLETAINELNFAIDNNLEHFTISGYTNLYILLSHVDESKNKQELLDRTFSLSISTNDVELVRRISLLGANINHQCHLCYGRPPLLIAIMYNENFELIKFLFSLKPDLTVLDYDGRTCLHYGAFSGNVELLEYLIVTSAMDINTKDKFGATPIYSAVENGNVEVYNYLLDKGALVNSKTKFGKNLLHAAAETGDVDFFRHVYYTSGLPLWNDGLFNLEPYSFAATEEIELFIKRETILKYGERYFPKKKRKMIFQNIFSNQID